MKRNIKVASIAIAYGLCMMGCACKHNHANDDANQSSCAPQNAQSSIDKFAANVAKIAEGENIFDPYIPETMDSVLAATQARLIATFDSIHPDAKIDDRTKIDSLTNETCNFIKSNSSVDSVAILAENGSTFSLRNLQNTNLQAQMTERHADAKDALRAERAAWTELCNNASLIGTSAIILNNWGSDDVASAAAAFEIMLLDTRRDLLNDVEKFVNSAKDENTDATMANAIAALSKQAESVIASTPKTPANGENADNYGKKYTDLQSCQKSFDQSVAKWAVELTKLMTAMGCKHPENAATSLMNGRIAMDKALQKAD